MNNELEAFARKGKRRKLRYYASLCLVELRDNTQTVRTNGVSAEI